jgi:Ca2+-binding RTX toxin-like protein
VDTDFVLPVEVRAGSGDDQIQAGGGPATIFAGSGNDVITGSTINDIISGGPGNDQLDGREGDDVIRGNEGDDQIRGAVGVDSLHGNDGRDTLFGGDDSDFLFGGDGDDVLSGERGDDLLVGESEDGSGSGSDFLQGGTGADRLEGGPDADELFGGTGGDELFGGPGNDLLVGGSAVRTSDLFAQLQPSADLDSHLLDGGLGDDLIYGTAGVDTVTDLAGLNLVETYESNDTVNLGPGNDLVWTGDGDDTVDAGDGNNRVFTGAGFDIVIAGTGNDLIDLRSFSASSSRARDVVASSDGGDDQLRGDGLAGPADGPHLEFATIGGNDTLQGGNGDDRLLGGGGRDVLWGGANTDVLEGHDGEDLLYGGGGIDFLRLDVDPQYAVRGGDTLLGHFGNASAGDVGDDGATDILQIEGTIHDDVILLSQDAQGNLVVLYETLTNGLPSAATLVQPFRDADGIATLEQFQINGLSGNDRLGFEQGATAVELSDLALRSTDWVGVINAGSGDDLVIGSGGRDRISGGPGSDDLFGVEGDDRLWGDDLDGSSGDRDRLFAGAGNDDPIGGVGTNELYAWSDFPSIGTAYGIFVDPATGERFDSPGPGRELEDTGLNRMLGRDRNDELYAGTGLDFMYGGEGQDTLYDRYGVELEFGYGVPESQEWLEYARSTDKVWYYGGTGTDDVITVDYVTEPGVLGDHHLITRLTENNGRFSFDAQVRLEFAATDQDGNLIWDPQDLVYRIEELNQIEDEDARQLGFDQLQLDGNILPPEGEFLAIIIDAQAGDDEVYVGPTVQRSVWVSAGDGDDRVEFASGSAILTDLADAGNRNEVAGVSSDPARAYLLNSEMTDEGREILPSERSTVWSNLTLDSPGDVDWYAISVAQALDNNASLSIDSIADTDAIDLGIYGTDADGNVILLESGTLLDQGSELADLQALLQTYVVDDTSVSDDAWAQFDTAAEFQRNMFASDAAFGGYYHYADPRLVGQAEVKWPFTDLLNDEYEVLATWFGGTTHAADTLFTVDGQQVNVNQQVAPDDVFIGGQPFANLTTITITDRNLDVGISTATEGRLAIADAVLVRPVQPRLPGLLRLDVRGNALNEPTHAVVIPSLQGRSVQVDLDTNAAPVWEPAIGNRVEETGGLIEIPDLNDFVFDPEGTTLTFLAAANHPQVDVEIKDALLSIRDNGADRDVEITVLAIDEGGRSAFHGLHVAFGSTLVDGVVFDDTNGNGSQEVNEAGLEGIIVYADLDEDGQFSPGEPAAATDIRGQYQLWTEESGTVNFRADTPENVLSVTPPARELDLPSGHATFHSVDFALVEALSIDAPSMTQEGSTVTARISLPNLDDGEGIWSIEGGNFDTSDSLSDEEIRFTPLEDGIYTLVYDYQTDNERFRDTHLLEVRSVEPSLDAGDDLLGGAAIPEGRLQLTRDMILDPGQDIWNVTIDYGDGREPVTLTDLRTRDVTLDHVYVDPGTYTIQLDVANDEATAADTLEVEVVTAEPLLTIDHSTDAFEGLPTTVDFIVEDPTLQADIVTWTFDVDWGDGTPLRTGQTVQHVFADPGTFRVTLAVGLFVVSVELPRPRPPRHPRVSSLTWTFRDRKLWCPPERSALKTISSNWRRRQLPWIENSTFTPWEVISRIGGAGREVDPGPARGVVLHSAQW